MAFSCRKWFFFLIHFPILIICVSGIKNKFILFAIDKKLSMKAVQQVVVKASRSAKGFKFYILRQSVGIYITWAFKGALYWNLDFLQNNVFYWDNHEELIFSPFCSTILQNGVRAY